MVLVGTLPQGYVRNVPLPRIPLGQSTSTPTSNNQIHTIPDYYEVPQGVPPYDTSRSIAENAAYAFSPAWHAIAINTSNNFGLILMETMLPFLHSQQF